MNVVKYMKAIRESGLPAPARHICLTLASLANPESGIIPERFQPGYKGLAKMTGLGRSTVIRYMPLIEDAGYVKKSAPSLQAAWGDKETNDYLLTLPTSPAAGLVPERDQSDDAKEQQVTGDTSQSGTSPAAGLVPERDSTSPAAGHEVPGPSDQNQNPTTSSSAAPPKDAPQSEPKKARRRKPEPFREDVERICEYLADKIEANGSKRPKINDDWRRAARLLLDEPRPHPVTVDGVIRAIDWCQPSDAEAELDGDRAFWRPNIMSMPKLREKYDQLRLAAKKPKGTGRGNARSSQGAGWRAPQGDAAEGYYARRKPQD